MFLAIAAHALAFLLGLAIIVGTLVSAVRTFVVPRSISDWLTWRVFLAMRRIFDTITLPIRTYLFKIPYHPTPTVETERISISRAEFDAAFDELAEAGVPMVSDREQAWRDFAGWRVNYDRVLLALANLTMAPYAPWTSDRMPLPVDSAFLSGKTTVLGR